MRWGQKPDTWQRWFAWRPVFTLDGQWVWLEHIWRTRLDGPLHEWRYQIAAPNEFGVVQLSDRNHQVGRHRGVPL